VLLLLKNLLFLFVVPAFIVGWVPYHWFEPQARVPASLGLQQLASAGLFVLSWAGLLHCHWLFARDGHGTPLPLDPPLRIVHRGLYGWVRNPMYLAVLGIVAAEALFFSSWDLAVYLLCLSCCFQLFVVLFEEPEMVREFGATYEDYRHQVPRWLPRRPLHRY